jgi:hypothetical protein
MDLKDVQEIRNRLAGMQCPLCEGILQNWLNTHNRNEMGLTKEDDFNSYFILDQMRLCDSRQDK